MAQNEQNNPLGAMVSEILQDPQKLQQFQQMAASLGLGSNPPPASVNNTNTANNSPDLSGLLAALNNANSGSAGNNNVASSTPDLSGLLAALNNANSNNNAGNSNASGSSSDLSSLLAALGGTNSGLAPKGNTGPDPAMLQKIMQAMQLFSQENPKVELLRALRPLLSEKRAKKVDDAIRIMQLMQVLPMLKESGLFGKNE